MINRRSRHLVVLVATYNRKKLLERSIDSIARGTTCSHEIIVIDGGSDDGTVEFLASNESITPVFQGELLGPARCYNQVWRDIESTYTCWLSDDTEVVPGSLDRAVDILNTEPEIGMVGLKMQDTIGPGSMEPYTGGRSVYGILNCNHGVLRTADLRAVGYFNESYHFYMIDPDLCASVLCTGKKVVMTKNISVLHHREVSRGETSEEREQRDRTGFDNNRIYADKFRFLDTEPRPLTKAGAVMASLLARAVFARSRPRDVRLGITRRDWDNIVHGRFIKLSDSFRSRSREYHLVQQIPDELCRSTANPYRHLVAHADS